jgi:hypothetical protein
LSKMSLSRWKADQRWRAWRTGGFNDLGWRLLRGISIYPHDVEENHIGWIRGG